MILSNTCDYCRHNEKELTDEPCLSCDEDYSNWEDPRTLQKEKEIKSMAVKTNKTKEMLLNEIEDLKKEIAILDKYKQYDEQAGELKAVYDSYIKAGFNEEQAFKILEIMLTGVTNLNSNVNVRGYLKR